MYAPGMGDGGRQVWGDFAFEGGYGSGGAICILSNRFEDPVDPGRGYRAGWEDGKTGVGGAKVAYIYLPNRFEAFVNIWMGCPGEGRGRRQEINE